MVRWIRRLNFKPEATLNRKSRLVRIVFPLFFNYLSSSLRPPTTAPLLYIPLESALYRSLTGVHLLSRDI